MMRVLPSLVVAAVFIVNIIYVSPCVIADPTLQVWLRLNDTQNSVYVPGTGVVNANSLGSQEYTSPGHYWLASYLNDVLYGLVWSGGTRHSVYAGNTSSNHTLMLNQSLTGSGVLLAFTSGDWKVINKHIENIENGVFFSYMLPSFAHGLGGTNTIAILLELNRIHPLYSYIFGKGRYQLDIRNMGLGGDGRVSLNINRTL